MGCDQQDSSVLRFQVSDQGGTSGAIPTTSGKTATPPTMNRWAPPNGAGVDHQWKPRPDISEHLSNIRKETVHLPPSLVGSLGRPGVVGVGKLSIN